MAIGASTEVIAGEGMILTPAAIDSHVHFICPQQIEEALTSGVTTLIGGGTARPPALTRPPAPPARGTWRACCRPATRSR